MEQKTTNSWAVVNKNTGKIAWLNTGSKRQAVFDTRREARLALWCGYTCFEGTVVRLS